ncbi:MAG: recombinase family protein [Candidatus Omnitrophota bacterium]
MIISDSKTPPKKHICAIYTRISHQEDREKSKYDTIEFQHEVCKRYIGLKEEEGWKVFNTRYEDRNYSGKDLNRPALKHLIQDAKEGKFTLIVVKALDRLTRSLKDFYALWEVLQAYKIELASATQEFSTTSPTGRLHLDMVLRFAQFERELASDRTREKMQYQASKGLFHGGYPPLGYDFKTGEKGILVINQKEARLVKWIFERYLRIGSVQKVAQELNSKGYRTKKWRTEQGKWRGGTRFNKGNLLNLLKNIAYIGKTSTGKGGNKEFHKAQWKGIVSEKTFHRANQMLNQNYRARGSSISENKYNLLLTGLVWCSHCGCQMSPNQSIKKGKVYLYYKCTSVSHGDKTACKIKSVPARELEHIVVDRIKYLSNNQPLTTKLVERAISSSKKRLTELLRDRAHLEAEKRKIGDEAAPFMEAIKKSKLAMIEEHLKPLQDRLDQISAQLSKVDYDINEERQKQIKDVDVLAAFRSFAEVFDSLPPDRQSELLHLLIKKIVYNGDLSKIDITFNNPPEIQKPPKSVGKAASGGSASHRFDKRMNWLPREDSNLGQRGYDLTPVTRRVGLSLHPNGMAGV